MSTLTGVVVGDKIVPTDSTDIYPTHEAQYGRGGHRTVATLSDRNNIPASRCEVGMLVSVTADGLVYKLKSGFHTPLIDGDWEIWGAGVSTFTALTDTPSTYTSKNNFLVRVNAAANALEFVNPSSVATATPTLQQVTTAGYTTDRPIYQSISGTAYTYGHYIGSEVGAAPITGSLYEGYFNNLIGSYYNDFGDNWVGCVNVIDASNFAVSGYLLKYDKTWQGTVGGDPKVTIKRDGTTYYKAVGHNDTDAHYYLTELAAAPGAILDPYRFGFSSQITTPSTSSGSGYVVGLRGLANANCTAVAGGFYSRIIGNSSGDSIAGDFYAYSLGTGTVNGTYCRIYAYDSPNIVAAHGNRVVLADTLNRTIIRYGGSVNISTVGGGTTYGYYSNINNTNINAISTGVYSGINLLGTYTTSSPSGVSRLFHGVYSGDTTVTYGADTAYGLSLVNNNTQRMGSFIHASGAWTNGIDFGGADITNILRSRYINIDGYTYYYTDLGPSLSPQNCILFNIYSGYADKNLNTFTIADRAASAAISLWRDRSSLPGIDHNAFEYNAWVYGDTTHKEAFKIRTSGATHVLNRARVNEVGLTINNTATALNTNSVMELYGNPVTAGSGFIKTYGAGSSSQMLFTDNMGLFGVRGDGQIKIRQYAQSSAPTIGSGYCAFWRDTDNNKLYLCFNDGSTTKYVELTA